MIAAIGQLMCVAVQGRRRISLDLMTIVAVHRTVRRVISVGARLERVLLRLGGIRVRLGQHVGGRRRGLGHSSNVEPGDAGGVFSAKLSFGGEKLMSTES